MSKRHRAALCNYRSDHWSLHTRNMNIQIYNDIDKNHIGTWYLLWICCSDPGSLLCDSRSHLGTFCSTPWPLVKKRLSAQSVNTQCWSCIDLKPISHELGYSLAHSSCRGCQSTSGWQTKQSHRSHGSYAIHQTHGKVCGAPQVLHFSLVLHGYVQRRGEVQSEQLR